MRNEARNGERKHLNRTGAALSPALTEDLLEGARNTQPSAEGDGDELARLRIEYAREAEPVGTIPPPASAKGMFKSAVKALTGKSALVLADKLGERMAFERSGVRLYDALLSKFDAYGSCDGGPTRPELEQIRAEEHEHFVLVKGCVEEMGADPTAVTPSANLHAVASKGLCAVLADPRTNLRDGLEAILVAELVDNDCWENLEDLARSLGHDDMADRFNQALREEQDHLRRVRRWLGQALSEAATGKLAEPFAVRTELREALAAMEPGQGKGLDGEAETMDEDELPARGRGRTAGQGGRSSASKSPTARRSSEKQQAGSDRSSAKSSPRSSASSSGKTTGKSGRNPSRNGAPVSGRKQSPARKPAGKSRASGGRSRRR